MRVLDHGSLDYIDHMGDDLFVVNRAKASYAKEALDLGHKEEKLIMFLAKHGHTSPFYHPKITIRIHAPISVQRQWYTHRIGVDNNSESTRYVTMKPQFYVPGILRKQSAVNKQGSEGLIEDTQNDICLNAMHRNYEYAIELYNYLLDCGVAREQARDVLPLSTYTSWDSTLSLYAAYNIYKLRTGEGAQEEIQEYAVALEQIVEPLFPLCWKELKEHHA